MNEAVYRRLLERRWRGKLTPAEIDSLRTWLESHPECRPDWEEEAALSGALSSLPNTPVPSNFTARVVERAVHRQRAAARPIYRWPWMRLLLPRTAIAAVLIGAGIFAYRDYAVTRRTELAQSVATVSEVASLPSPAILQDFEAIRQMSLAPRADNELLALME